MLQFYVQTTAMLSSSVKCMTSLVIMANLCAPNLAQGHFSSILWILFLAPINTLPFYCGQTTNRATPLNTCPWNSTDLSKDPLPHWNMTLLPAEEAAVWSNAAIYIGPYFPQAPWETLLRCGGSWKVTPGERTYAMKILEFQIQQEMKVSELFCVQV